MENSKTKNDLSAVMAKRSSMLFYSNAQDHYSHRVRIVLAEKGVSVEVVNVEPGGLPEEVRDLNPYNSLPTLVDRDLVLYQANVMMEYLDERFPHPPLLPVYPVARAQSRLWMYRVERDWCPLVDAILNQSLPTSSAVVPLNPAASALAVDIPACRKKLADSLLAVAPIFLEKPFFMSEEFGLIDCCVAPIIWRLPLLGIDFTESQATRGIFQYAKRLFERDSFQLSLSEVEREQGNWLKQK
jgi:stringent starvation protein A